MKRQRGITTGWLIGIIALGFLLVASYFFGRHDGSKINETAWQAREAKINARAAVQIKAATDRVREIEAGHAIQLNAVDAYYQRKLKGKNDALEIALNAVSAGGRLYAHATCPPAAGNSDGQATAGAGVRDGGTRAELSAADSTFLLRIGAEADSVVLQLRACQAIVREDRR